MLSGLSLPISEDLLLLTAGALASTCQHEPWEIARLYFVIYIACWVAAWEAYWVGRLFGPKLFTFRWFRHLITPNRLEKIRSYIERFGIFTFIVGRFIPGGRNALFMSTGLTKMPFMLFVLRDSVGCLLSTGLLFSLGYLFGANFQAIAEVIKVYQKIFLLSLVGILFILLIYFFYTCNKTKRSSA